MNLPSATIRSASAFAAALAFVAGYCDAEAFLRWHLFGANMTGNTVLFGIALVGKDASHILQVAGPIAAFVTGVVLARSLSIRWAPVVALAIETLMLIGAAFTEHQPAQLELIALAMGIQNTALATFAGVQLNTSFITGDYSRLGQALADVLWRKGDARQREALIIVTPLLVAYGAGAAACSSVRAAAIDHALLFVAPLVLFVAYASTRLQTQH